MDIEGEAIAYSEGLSIPTHRLEFNSYYDQQQQGEVTQVFFRDEYPPKEKYAFEIMRADGSGVPDSITRDQLHRMMKTMEQTYLDNSGRVTFYKGQAFFWQEVAYDRERDFKANSSQFKVEPDEKYLKIECTSCGWELESPEVKAESFDTYRDVILMWLLARGKGRCDCDHFEPVDGRRDEDLDLEPEELNVEEGKRIPRTQP